MPRNRTKKTFGVEFCGRRKLLQTNWDFQCQCLRRWTFITKKKTTKRILRIDNIRCSAPDDRRCTLCPACITAGDLLFEAGKAVCSMMSQHWRDSKVHVSCILILVIAYQKLNIHSLQAALLALSLCRAELFRAQHHCPRTGLLNVTQQQQLGWNLWLQALQPDI